MKVIIQIDAVNQQDVDIAMDILKKLQYKPAQVVKDSLPKFREKLFYSISDKQFPTICSHVPSAETYEFAEWVLAKFVPAVYE